MSVSFFLSYVALWVLVVFQALVLLGLTRVVHELQSRGSGLPLLGSSNGTYGKQAPRFSAVDLSGRRVDSATFRGKTTALLFVSPDCSSCTLALEEMDGLRAKANGNVVVVCQAGTDQCRDLVGRYQLGVAVVADEGGEIGALFSIPGVPVAVMIDEHNRVVSYGEPKRVEELQQELLEERQVGDGAVEPSR